MYSLETEKLVASAAKYQKLFNQANAAGLRRMWALLWMLITVTATGPVACCYAHLL